MNLTVVNGLILSPLDNAGSRNRHNQSTTVNASVGNDCRVMIFQHNDTGIFHPLS